jgi:hypothetical protein
MDEIPERTDMIIQLLREWQRLPHQPEYTLRNSFFQWRLLLKQFSLCGSL